MVAASFESASFVRLRRWAYYGLCAAILASGAAQAADEAAEASAAALITGGPDASRQNYKWVVKNQHDSPLVSIQFPEENSDVFQPPDGWTLDIALPHGLEPRPKTRTATVEDPDGGLTAGRAATFYMRISTGGARARPRDVLVRFADGSTARIPDVMAPTSLSAGEEHVGLIGLAVLLGGALLYHRWRQRKQDAPPPTDAE